MGKIDLKVSATSNPKSVAGSIAKNLQEGNDVSVVYIGAGAGNQAAKAMAIARSYVAANGMNLAYIPGFGEAFVDEGGEQKKKTTLVWAVVKM